MKPTVSRRGFLAKSVAAGVTARATLGARASAAPIGVNDAVRIAVVGLRWKGGEHANMLKGMAGVRLVALCDVDERLLDEWIAKLGKDGVQPARYTDYRKLLEAKDVDAVVIATPNHWHSLMGIWACQAGKDAYVEKPVAHNVWEGRRLVEAAAKYGRIVAAGTQSRSDEALRELVEDVRGGKLGKLVRIRGFCYKRRDSIGRVAGPQPIPPGVHYDLWCGPSPLEPLRRTQLHYDWHWFWNTGNGDIGNQGIHEIDVCRWMLGEDQLPPRVVSFGGRFGYVDDAQVPNTQVALLDYPKAPILFEVRGLPAKAGVNYLDQYKGIRIGYVIEGEAGYFAGAAGGGWLYDSAGKKVKQYSGSGGEKHMQNFVDAVRSRRAQDLNAPILDGHLSSSLSILANISYRLGAETALAELKARFESRPEMREAVERMQAHLAANGLDPAQTKPVVGPTLELQPAEERFVSRAEYDDGYFANGLLRDRYRDPFVVPEKV